MEGLLDALGGKSHRIWIPNYGHGCASQRHIEAMRMALDVVLLGRPLSRIRSVDSQVTGRTLSASARVRGGADVQEVRLYYATFSDVNTFNSSNLPDTPERNFEDLLWQSVPMNQGVVGRWDVDLDLSASTDDFVAFFVDVRDTFQGRNGYVSSSMESCRLR